jgi:hypothetical protein
MTDANIFLVISGMAQVGILTGIFFRLGRGAAKIEELYRRVISLEKTMVTIMTGIRGKK